MKKIMGLLGVMLFAVAGFAQAETEVPYKKIDAFELQELMKNPEVVVIDSRGKKHFDGVVIQGAKHLSVKQTNEETLAAIAPNKATPLVFYCANVKCPSGSIAAYKADKAGYTELYEFSGGIEAWLGQDFPTDTL